MPVIRVMNWNIRKLSWNKIQIPGMATAIARVVVAANVDILVICELTIVNSGGTMTNLTAELDLQAGVAGLYYWLRSPPTGGEQYGFIVRDVNVVRPLQFVANPNAPLPHPNGTYQQPLVDLRAQRWTTWPAAFPGPAVALPPGPAMGLIDLFQTPVHDRAAKRGRFAGQAINNGGYALGRGRRLPCLAMFMVHGAALTLVPIVVCHYAAVRGGRNFLGQQQIAQLHQLHIAQLFSFYNVLAHPVPPPTSGYLDVDGAAVAVQNIMYTGDFNVDFLKNRAAPMGDHLQSVNRAALDRLTPTVQQGGSVAPAAAAGAPGAVPAVPFPAGTFVPGAPIVSNIPRQALRAACTTSGTILKQLPAAPPMPVPPPNTAALRAAAFDNFLYGGTELNTAVLAAGAPPNDSGQIIDVPFDIQQPGAPPPAINVGPLQIHYAPAGTHRANLAPNLAGGVGAAPLTVNDRWIGAYLISDHVPAVLQFQCP